jgi:hypothetical protein
MLCNLTFKKIGFNVSDLESNLQLSTNMLLCATQCESYEVVICNTTYKKIGLVYVQYIQCDHMNYFSVHVICKKTIIMK